DIYIAKLVKAGYKVAICEQMTLPNKKGIIKREVIRTVTPGTMLDENALEKKENNYILVQDYIRVKNFLVNRAISCIDFQTDS
ncbi:MAG: hypothetical protein ACRDFB_09665, partial [Rhabdochlamydiaceae bacterium]